MQSSIFDNRLKVKIDCHTRPQIVTKLLLQVFVRELHNSLISDTDVAVPEQVGPENSAVQEGGESEATKVGCGGREISNLKSFQHLWAPH